MRLYYHADRDSLFWDEFNADPGCDDVTDQAKFQDAAALRGIICPGPITPVVDANILNSQSAEGAAALTVRGCGTVWKEEPKTGGMAGAIQASYKKWERKPSDFYATPYEGTESIMPAIKSLVAPGGKIWEPCSGDMDMARVLEWHGYEVTATELRETGQGIGGFDFLADDPQDKWGWIPDPDMIVMNPPFSLAAEFILKALSYTPRVACLLKIDYWNAISRLPMFRDNMPKLFMPLTFRLAFLKKERGNSPLMNCAWGIWHDGGENFCAFEPLKKAVYPGYNSDGVRTSLAKLGQAVDDLTETICAH